MKPKKEENLMQSKASIHLYNDPKNKDFNWSMENTSNIEE